MRSSSSPPAGGSWRLSPRPPEGAEPVDPWKGREIVLAIIETFMRKHTVYDVIRIKHRDTYNTIQLKLEASRATLRVSSRQLREGKPVEVITLELIALGKGVIDSVRVHIDNSSIKNLSAREPSIDKIWKAWARKFGEVYCHMGWTSAGPVIADHYTFGDCEEPGW